MPLVTGVVVLVFGALTLCFQDDTFIKIKPTITNVLFGSVLLGGLVFGQSLLRYVFGDVYKLKHRGWYLLTLRWGMFFFVLAVVNEFVWRNFSDRFLGGVQGLGHHAHHHDLCHGANAAFDQICPRSRRGQAGRRPGQGGCHGRANRRLTAFGIDRNGLICDSQPQAGGMIALWHGGFDAKAVYRTAAVPGDEFHPVSQARRADWCALDRSAKTITSPCAISAMSITAWPTRSAICSSGSPMPNPLS